MSIITMNKENDENEKLEDTTNQSMEIDATKNLYPFCVVWTSIPVLTWLFPLIGHMGICTSKGVIRDFAGPYFVSENDMAFGDPLKYWQLDLSLVSDGRHGWDEAVKKASNIYLKRMHILCWDNCHSHVATALNIMNYNQISSYNMVKLFFLFTFHSKYINCLSFIRTWLPFLLICASIGLICIFIKMSEPSHH